VKRSQQNCGCNLFATLQLRRRGKIEREGGEREKDRERERGVLVGCRSSLTFRCEWHTLP
jgi:hypothetical protein